MTIALPEQFKTRMARFLQEDYPAFIESYNLPISGALRLNSLKIGVVDFLTLSPFTLKAIPWVSNGFYYSKDDHPGKHPYHDAGVYYMQEASAMAVGVLAQPKPGERVLDLCAAPGGKSTHLASQMAGQGLLVANEINGKRAKILSENVERMGIKNAVVMNETPEKLAEHFPAFFDRIVVDAPCSGEGMFKKEPQAIEQWSLANIDLCARRQKEILTEAVKLLKPGGTLIYSTCTFAPEENEGTISWLLQTYDFLKLIRPVEIAEFDHGHPEWVDGPAELKNAYRLWSHHLLGEGHFIAVLKDTRETGSENSSVHQRDKRDKNSKSKHLSRKSKQSQELATAVDYFEAFKTQSLSDSSMIAHSGLFVDEAIDDSQSHFILFGDNLYLLPNDFSLDGLKVIRPGLHLGTLKKKRFEPAHALALSLQPSQVREKVMITSDVIIEKYLHGEVLQESDLLAEGIEDLSDGWQLVCYHNFPLGWGKYANNQLKNHYPKGLRWL